jgi:tetratricopeptide (TPR) repeat protein/DNA-binding SARP family transcriptional activator
MEFRALGPIELWSAGQRSDLGAARLRCILAMFLLTPRTVMPVETLIDRLWDTRPPPKARESLSVYIARLRASLRQAVGDRVQLVGRARGYVLEVDPESVDVHQFRRLRRQANALAASGDHHHAAELLREADLLWRGQALAGIGGDWAARMRDSLEEERRAAIVERVGCELELGRHADLVSELRYLLAQYPLDETLVAHQMTALYRSGRPTDALSLYRETRGRLVDEQGTEPGPVLSELHQRILGRDPELAGPSGQRPAGTALPDTLPPDPPEFVGRQKELADLADLTGEPGSTPHIVIIAGMPGVGKTALAVRAARLASQQYPDGTLYLNLHSHDPGSSALDPAEALDRLLQMLSVPAAQIPDTISERAALWRADLSRRRAVVILDDAAGHDQIRPLLPVTGRCLILITTRLPDSEGARTLPLDVLSADEAATLFRQTAGEGSAGDADQVAAAVRLCGRLPLAIQLTAGRIARDAPRSLDGLIEELSQSPARLGSTGTDSPEVIAAFDLSYRALEPDHQRFFRRLGISPCAHLSLPAAAALGDCTLAEAEKTLATLVDGHLLAQTPDGQFRFHDLIRGYAAVRAAQDDPEAERRQAVGRLLDYYLYAADRADRVLFPFRRRTPVRVTQPPAASPALGGPEDAAAWLDSEWRNILEAARYAGRHEWKGKCADLTHVLADFVEIKAYWDEAIAAHTVALQASRDLAEPARIAQALLALSAVRQQTGQHEAALALAEEAAEIYRSLADRNGEAESLDQIGLAHQRTARSREALAYFQEAEILYRAASDQRGVANILSHSGIACWHLGRYAEANAHLNGALSLYREIDDRRGEAKALNNLGRIFLHNGSHGKALDAYQKALQIFQEIGGTQSEAIVYQNIGSAYRCQGSYSEGLAAYRQALTIYREIGDLPDEADVLNDIGLIYQSAERHDEALVHHREARQIAEEIGNLSQQLIALRWIADIHRGLGQYREALDHYQAALRLSREIGDPYEEGKILEGIAESTLSAQRQPIAARIAYRQALDIFERLGVPDAESARSRIQTIDPAFSLRTS